MIRIALAGNPNSGKTTLFNALTGSNQFVGNWPGVTVEKKEGRLKQNKEVLIADLPGIYSLSPYTMEEIVSRNYLIQEKPDAILNIVDGTNLERNLYLTTQLLELGIPVVVAVNMMDEVEKRGDILHIDALAKALGCPVVPISALKGSGVQEAAKKAVEAAQYGTGECKHTFAPAVELALQKIAHQLQVAENQKRYFAIKLFERDEKIGQSLSVVPDVESIIAQTEKELDDDSESIITNERYTFISSIIDDCLTKRNQNTFTTSDKIDKVVTNRFLALPIFAIVMYLVYYVSVTTVGTWATDWANDGVFGDGWHLYGGSAYTEDSEAYSEASTILNGFVEFYGEENVAEALNSESETYDVQNAKTAAETFAASIGMEDEATYAVVDEETMATEMVTATGAELAEAVQVLDDFDFTEPDPADYGLWVPGVPVFIGNALESMQVADWLQGLILDGIVAGCGAVLGFVPQMLVLFFFLALLESCGYMARIAFIMDRIFRRFGLSGKSFIPILIGTGCGVPGIMASRTIENERDRRMTITTTTFIPCGAKLPFIAMVAGAIFGGASWVAPSAYFLGMAAIIISGIILKKTKRFLGDPAPFVMELPAYHMPTLGNVLRSMWERGSSFIKKAGTIILLSTIFIWFTSYFGFVDGSFTMLTEEQMDQSLLAGIGKAIAWIFIPLGFGNWQATVASITGLVAKENIVGTMGILYSGGMGTVYENMAASFTALSGYAFLVFNLLCAPCFAAMGAIKREMNSTRWFAFAVAYQCGFAYAIGLIVYQLGNFVLNGTFGIGTAAAILILGYGLYLLFRPNPEAKSKKAVKVNA